MVPKEQNLIFPQIYIHTYILQIQVSSFVEERTNIKVAKKRFSSNDMNRKRV